MKIKKFSKKPTDIERRVGADPVVCYPNDTINNNLEILHEARKHIKQVDEVKEGTECGMSLANYEDIKEGDLIECFEIKTEIPTLK